MSAHGGPEENEELWEMHRGIKGREWKGKKKKQERRGP
jgi:hypothetical protein